MPEEAANRYPLTSQQKDPDHTERNSRHVIPTALRIKGELRVDALRGALDEVVERHESLRTRIYYDETDGSLGYQEVLPPLPVPFTVHDLPMIAGRSRDQLAADLLVKMHEEQLDFSVTPSLRAALHRFDDHDAVLTLLTHHLFGDNWSTGVLRREVAACYNARVSGVPHTLQPPVQYREYASAEREFLQSERAAQARRFWLANLAGAKMHTMPASLPAVPDAPTSRSAVSNFLIDPQDSAKITASARQHRCTAWHLFLTASMVLAAEVRGSSDVTVLTVNNGRNAKGFQNTIGFFANLVPLRVEFGDCESYRDLMLLARKTSIDAHQNLIPFGEVLELAPDLMKPLEDPRNMPFALNYARPAAALADIQFAGSVEPVVLPEDLPSMYHRGSCLWSLVMLPSGAFRCVIEYEPDLVDADTIDRWGSDFINLLMVIADRPDQAWKNRRPSA